jgi:CDP-diacylglycerol--glycerol-3-phosphate 3-phosphatidyltransferase
MESSNIAAPRPPLHNSSPGGNPRPNVDCFSVTLANKITISRICLIPVFALAMLAYMSTVEFGNPDPRLRWLAAAVFFIASATDGIDGYIARRYNQRSRLGAILDPIADKGLVITALVLLSTKSSAFPAWFPLFVIARDLILMIGFVFLSARFHRLEVRPNLIGKLATILQIVSILIFLTGFPWIDLLIPVTLATALTVASGVSYAIEGINQATRHRKC